MLVLKSGRAAKFAYLDRLLKTESVLLTEANASPFQHLSLFSEVRNGERLVLGQKGLVFSSDEVVDFIEEILAALNPCFSF